jgi:peptidoglycan/xylan/chitin deacetylase (PgdA/CDA1 family)
MSLSIVMYHYVRDLDRTGYPAIKGRDLAAFRAQLDYIARHYTVVTAEQVVAAVKDGEPLPDNPAWLTFDDGYTDHYSAVFPLLHERGWQGSFFPSAGTVLYGELLVVNRIHFILAAQPDARLVLTAIRRFVEERRPDGAVRSFDEYWQDLAHASRFDPAEVVFIKRMLQHGLPENLRDELTRSLFQRFVSVDPAAFAAELYMTSDQLRTMIRGGMYVGSHGARHCWLDRLDPSRQAGEVDASLDLLRTLGAPTEDWVMCYPYGAYDDTLLRLLRERGCAVGLTTRVAVAQLGLDDALALPRLDTNDLPIDC